MLTLAFAGRLPALNAVGWAVAGLVVVGLLLLLLRWRLDRRRIEALLARLEELESRLTVEERTAAEQAAGEQAPAEQAAAELPAADPSLALSRLGHPIAAGAVVATPSGDVLKGLTSEVRRIVAGPTGEARTLAEQAIAAIYRHLGETVAPNDLAAELFVSLRTLERGLAHTLGCTPRQLILAVKMREARKMLASGRFRVKEVAFRLGFADQYHFSRCFKSFYHVSPSEIRPAH